MAHTKGVVFTLRTRWKWSDAIWTPEFLHPLPTTREYFMGVSLMTNIPNEFVLWRFEDIVERYSKLYDTKSGAEVTTSLSNGINKEVPKLVSKLFKLSFV